MYKHGLNKNLIVSLVLVAGSLILTSSKAYAGNTGDGDCTPTYGGGEDCIYDRSFKVEKSVRKEGDDEWEDKVTDVEEGDIVEFRIKIRNTGNVEVDGMKYDDDLPDEMERVGGDGLTEYWDDFMPGESEEFVIRAKIEDKIFDEENKEDCLTNKVSAFRDGEFVGSDTAIVCYDNGELTELPKTGAESSALISALGLGLTALGALIKKSRK